VALLGVRMPDGDGLNTLGRIKLDLPEQPVLMFSTLDNPSHAARAVALDANGFLHTTATREELVEAIRTAAAGKNTWTREGLRRVSGSLATPRHSGDIEVSLTNREFDVLKHICDGSTNKEIALELGISYETVKEHVQHVLRKLRLGDRTQAAVWAVRKGLV
jgi:DNA-binding NarL/FixJ family response regulator